MDQLKGSSSKTQLSNVNAVDVPMSAAAKMSLENKKKRENTLQLEVQALKAESDAQRKLITDLIKDNNKNFAEIKSVLSDNRGNGHNSFGAGSSAGFNAGPDQNQNWRDHQQPMHMNFQPNNNQMRGTNKRNFMCENCKSTKSPYCNHCLKCSGAGHRADNCTVFKNLNET